MEKDFIEDYLSKEKEIKNELLFFVGHDHENETKEDDE